MTSAGSTINIPRQRKGQALLEVAAGAIVLIPIVLFGLDAIVYINASHTNEELTQTIARAAANVREPDQARESAQERLQTFTKSNLMGEIKITKFLFDTSQKMVTVTVQMQVYVPVPIPGMGDVQTTATCSEPIVAIPPAV